MSKLKHINMSAVVSNILSESFVNPKSALLYNAAMVRPDSHSIDLLYKGNLPDSPQVFVVKDFYRKEKAIVQLSAPLAPDVVERGVARARQAAKILGKSLADSVLTPIAEGKIGGRSYAVTTFCKSYSSSRLPWYFERSALCTEVFGWLRDDVSTTLAPVPDRERTQDFEEPLRLLLKLEGTSETLRRLADQSRARVQSGDWSPSYVLMHGDLWKGNLLRLSEVPPRANRGWKNRMVVIDWGGSKQHGYAFFDLLRAAESLRVRPARVRSEIMNHAAILKCQLVDVGSYVRSALASLLRELENFPVERFVAMAEACIEALVRAVPEVLNPGPLGQHGENPNLPRPA